MAPACKACGGTTIPNPRKKALNHPDWLCNQDNGKCGTDVQALNRAGQPQTYFNPTAAWNPKPEAAPVPAGTPMVKAPTTPANPTGDGYVPDEEAKKWAKIGEQKNRSNLAAAILQGKDLDWKVLQQVEAWVLSGKTPEELGEEIDVSNVPF